MLVTSMKELSNNTINKWKEDNANPLTVYGIDFLDTYMDRRSLFGVKEPVIVIMEDIKKADFERLYKIKNNNVLLILNKNVKFNTSKMDRLEVIHEEVSSKAITKRLREEHKLSNDKINIINNSTDNPASKIILANQIALLSDSDGEMAKYLIDPLKDPDTAPWGLFDAILNGDTSSAIEQLEILLFYTNDPISLIFQMSGYMKNVLITLDKNQKVITDKRQYFFQKKARNIKDVELFINDIEELNSRMYDVSKEDLVILLKSSVYNMASRCK